MRRTSVICLVATVLLLAHEPVPLGSETMREATADRGDLLFRDSFDDTLSPQWTVDRPDAWQVVDGHLRATQPNEKQVRSFAYAGSDRWRDYAVDFDVCGVRGVDKGAVVRVDGDRRGVGIDLRSNRYMDILMYRGYEHWARASIPNRNGVWYHVRIEARRNRYRVFVNDTPTIDFTDESNSRPRGRIALAAYTGGVAECEILFDNVEVRALR